MPIDDIDPVITAAVETKAIGAVEGGQFDIEKKLKKLQKKLDSIHELKIKQTHGIALELTQIQKIGTEMELITEIEKVKRSLLE